MCYSEYLNYLPATYTNPEEFSKVNHLSLDSLNVYDEDNNEVSISFEQSKEIEECILNNLTIEY